MPWRCPGCKTEVVVDGLATCPACGAAKAAWTLFGEKTRHFVVPGKRLLVLRGSDAAARTRDDPARVGDVPVEATRAVSVRKEVARELAARRLLPPSSKLLLVRLVAKGANTRDVTLVAALTQGEAAEHRLPPFGPADAAGAVDVPILLVHGAGDLAGLAFEGVHVVDVTDGDGHVPQVEVSGLRRPPVTLPVGHFVAARLRGADGAPAADVAVVLVGPDGGRREGRTDAEGRVRWTSVEEGPHRLELAGDGHVPELDEPPVAAPAPTAVPPEEPAPDDEDLEPHDVSGRKSPFGSHWAAVRLVEPDGAPAAFVAVVLACADGSRRPATTDADGRARWARLPAGPTRLELADDGAVPELDPSPIEAPPARTSGRAPDRAPDDHAPDDPGDGVLEEPELAGKHPRHLAGPPAAEEDA